MKVLVQREDFDSGAEIEAVARGNPKVGAVASFVGLVRDINEDAAVRTMTLEHYPGMTERAIAQIVEEARTRWDVIDCTVIHRFGELKPADRIVLVAVASGHRGDAFAACEFIMDYLKTDAVFWKRESGTAGARWIDSTGEDRERVRTWDRADRDG